MIKDLTICLITTFFALLFVSSTSAKVTVTSEYKYIVLQDTGTAKSCEGLSKCPDNAICITKSVGCFEFSECKDGYVLLNDVCTLNDCSDYPLTGCNKNHGTFNSCPTDTTKCIYTKCTNGFTLNSSGDCVCTGNGVTESSSACKCNAGSGWEPKSGSYAPCQASKCPSGSTTPNCGANQSPSSTGYLSGGSMCYTCVSTYVCSAYYAAASECGSQVGWSLVDDGTTDKNGKKCQKCSCSATDHTLTSKPNATTTNFSTGCNGKYKFTSCKEDAGYYSQEACYKPGDVNYGPLSYWTAANMGL